jgi:subtilisin family serine protease
MGSFRAPWSRRLAALGVAAAGGLAIATVTAVPANALGEIVNAGIPNAIPNSYIVIFNGNNTMSAQGVDTLTADLAAKADAKVQYKYTAALRGFAGTMSETAARKLAANPNVAYVEQNGTVQALADQANPPSWGLDRVDQRNLPLNSNYHYDTTASNVTAYIIDTGIRLTHVTFGGRATWGTNTTGDGQDTDCNGHGTHVSGTVGGDLYGLAKGVHLVAVKVLTCNGSGSFAGVAQGIDFVTSTHQSGQLAVANMSLGGSGQDPTGEAAVRNAIADGVVFSIASGNSNADACNFTPAREPLAITVNASTINDARASFSNFGTCTDIFGPGENITSSWGTSDTGTMTISGTSMATPHVTGASALYLAANPSATPAQVQQALKDNSTPNKITNPGTGSPNRLLYTLFGAPGGPSVNNPGNQTGTVGGSANLTLTASGGTPPYTWSASGLPTGLSINASTGQITGTYGAAGTFNVAVTVNGGGTGTTSFTWTVSPAGGGCSSPGQKLGNPGFESGAASWTATSGVIGQWGASGQPTHGGTWNAWMDGYGTTHTDTLSQTVTIPAGCTASTLSFWLHIDTSETTTSTQFDRLTVQVGSTTVATYSNLNRAAGYSLKSFNVGSFAGQTVTIKFTATEDISLQTSFVVDDTALNAG